MSSTTSTPPTPPVSGQRSLAAIIFTDVVSFSARMQADEESTLRLLKRDFDLMREVCTQHHGSVLKTTGDGLLLYFASAVQAVACALAMQRTFAEQARSRPAEETLVHRLGIHLGDVFVNEQDVMGDGVNIAARLQAEAEPGGICISQTVYDVVRNKLALHVTKLGARELKNISQAVPIYKLLLEAQGVKGPKPEKIATVPPFGKKKSRKLLWIALGVVAAIVLTVVVVLVTRSLDAAEERRAAAEASQTAFNALMEPDPTAETILPPDRLHRTLADWRQEMRAKRSRAFDDYNLGELSQNVRDPRSPLAGKPEGRARAQVVQRVQVLQDWMTTALQRYNRERPLVVRELTGTAPKEIRVYVGADRRLYYAEGGAVRQRDWQGLRPSILAAIVAGAMIEADPLPPRAAVQGALAFADLYQLPELPEALRQGRLKRLAP